MPTLLRPVTLAILVIPIVLNSGARRFCVSNGEQYRFVPLR